MKSFKKLSLLAIFCFATILTSIVPISAADDYTAALDFLTADTFNPYLVYNNGMQAAGNSTTMGYKGWISSTNKDGTAVFKFQAESGKTFNSFVFSYIGYSIAVEAADIYDFYVSTTAEDFTAAEFAYNASNWTLVSALRNNSSAGTGVYAADPTNRSADLIRTIDLSSYAKGKSVVYVRIDAHRSTNIDSLPTVYGGKYAVNASYQGASNTTAAGTTTTAKGSNTTTPATGDLSYAVPVTAALVVFSAIIIMVTRKKKGIS